MRVFLVHHGQALDPTVESIRPLSPDGHRVTDALARRAAALGVRPAHVWHSGKLRAKQTAELYWRHCNALAEFKAVRGLQPSDDPSLVPLLLKESLGADVMLVGHYPHLPAVFHLLCDEGADAAKSPGAALRHFPQNGMVALESTPDARGWVEAFRLSPADVAL